MEHMTEKRSKMVIYPGTSRRLKQLGEQIRLARLRRRLSVKLVAERAGASESSVWAVENGSPTVAIGIYANILMAIGIQDDLTLIARDDELGRSLQDAELEGRRRRNKQ